MLIDQLREISEMRDAFMVDDSDSMKDLNGTMSAATSKSRVYLLQFDAELKAIEQAIEETRAVIAHFQSGV
jgi:hypothetical protein